jgi:hypothetical protein
MENSSMPSRPGQICKIVSELNDLGTEEVYIVAEDPAGFDNSDDILVVSLTALQRNIKHPDNAQRIAVRKDNLVVVAEDLTSHVESWNLKH